MCSIALVGVAHTAAASITHTAHGRVTVATRLTAALERLKTTQPVATYKLIITRPRPHGSNQQTSALRDTNRRTEIAAILQPRPRQRRQQQQPQPLALSAGSLTTTLHTHYSLHSSLLLPLSPLLAA